MMAFGANPASVHNCRMRRERLIRPTDPAQVCRHDKTRQRRIRHLRTIAGCGVNALSSPPIRHRFVGMIRRASVASGTGAQLPDAV
ncbi:hypothetical protein [Escherichia coli]|uniref:hypothetical protein n=1 Tax=Escherichia coli TaxID=562 RepID=UPI00032533E7